MSGLYASVPEHVSSAIGRLEDAFCTNKNVKLTIEDATVRVQSGAMQYMHRAGTSLAKSSRPCPWHRAPPAWF